MDDCVLDNCSLFSRRLARRSSLVSALLFWSFLLVAAIFASVLRCFCYSMFCDVAVVVVLLFCCRCCCGRWSCFVLLCCVLSCWCCCLHAHGHSTYIGTSSPETYYGHENSYLSCTNSLRNNRSLLALPFLLWATWAFQWTAPWSACRIGWSR